MGRAVILSKKERRRLHESYMAVVDDMLDEERDERNDYRNLVFLSGIVLAQD